MRLFNESAIRRVRFAEWSDHPRSADSTAPLAAILSCVRVGYFDETDALALLMACARKSEARRDDHFAREHSRF
jgi:hypothetical protein